LEKVVAYTAKFFEPEFADMKQLAPTFITPAIKIFMYGTERITSYCDNVSIAKAGYLHIFRKNIIGIIMNRYSPMCAFQNQTNLYISVQKLQLQVVNEIALAGSEPLITAHNLRLLAMESCENFNLTVNAE
jgi:hypothetical protein